VSSSPPDLSDFTLTSHNPKKSTPSGWPGKTPETPPPKPRKSRDQGCRFSSFLSPGTSLTCACARVLTDLSTDFSHRSVIFFAACAAGAVRCLTPGYIRKSVTVTPSSRWRAASARPTDGRLGAHGQKARPQRYPAAHRGWTTLRLGKWSRWHARLHHHHHAHPGPAPGHRTPQRLPPPWIRVVRQHKSQRVSQAAALPRLARGELRPSAASCNVGLVTGPGPND
jgi:hypothetical protein